MGRHLNKIRGNFKQLRELGVSNLNVPDTKQRDPESRRLVVALTVIRIVEKADYSII